MKIPKFIRMQWDAKGLYIMNFSQIDTDITKNNEEFFMVHCFLSSLNIWEYSDCKKKRKLLKSDESDNGQMYEEQVDELQAKEPQSTKNIPALDIYEMCSNQFELSEDDWKTWLNYWDICCENLVLISWFQRFPNLTSIELKLHFFEVIEKYPELLDIVQFHIELPVNKEDILVKYNLENLDFIDEVHLSSEDDQYYRQFYTDSEPFNFTKKLILDAVYQEFQILRYWVHFRMYLKLHEYQITDELKAWFISKGITEDPEKHFKDIDLNKICQGLKNMSQNVQNQSGIEVNEETGSAENVQKKPGIEVNKETEYAENVQNKSGIEVNEETGSAENVQNQSGIEVNEETEYAENVQNQSGIEVNEETGSAENVQNQSGIEVNEETGSAENVQNQSGIEVNEEAGSAENVQNQSGIEVNEETESAENVQNQSDGIEVNEETESAENVQNQSGIEVKNEETGSVENVQNKSSIEVNEETESAENVQNQSDGIEVKEETRSAENVQNQSGIEVKEETRSAENIQNKSGIEVNEETESAENVQNQSDGIDVNEGTGSAENVQNESDGIEVNEKTESADSITNNDLDDCSPESTELTSSYEDFSEELCDLVHDGEKAPNETASCNEETLINDLNNEMKNIKSAEEDSSNVKTEMGLQKIKDNESKDIGVTGEDSIDVNAEMDEPSNKENMDTKESQSIGDVESKLQEQEDNETIEIAITEGDAQREEDDKEINTDEAKKIEISDDFSQKTAIEEAKDIEDDSSNNIEKIYEDLQNVSINSDDETTSYSEGDETIVATKSDRDRIYKEKIASVDDKKKRRYSSLVAKKSKKVNKTSDPCSENKNSTANTATKAEKKPKKCYQQSAASHGLGLLINDLREKERAKKELDAASEIKQPIIEEEVISSSKYVKREKRFEPNPLEDKAKTKVNAYNDLSNEDEFSEDDLNARLGGVPKGMVGPGCKVPRSVNSYRPWFHRLLPIFVQTIFNLFSDAVTNLLHPIQSLFMVESNRDYNIRINREAVREQKEAKAMRKVVINTRPLVRHTPCAPPLIPSIPEIALIKFGSQPDRRQKRDDLVESMIVSEEDSSEEYPAGVHANFLDKEAMDELMKDESKTIESSGEKRTHIIFDEEGDPKEVDYYPVDTKVRSMQRKRSFSIKANMLLEQYRLQRYEHSADEDIPEGISEEIVKYWHQRYRLFLKYDAGIQLDNESWFSVTPEMIAVHQAYRCTCHTVIDAFCGAGGNAIQFTAYCNKVIAIDIDPKKIEMARHNARIYGVEDQIKFIVGDFFKLAPKLEGDVVYLSPPWGGVTYLGDETYDVFKLDGSVDGQQLMKTAQKISKNVAIYLPKSSNIYQIAYLSRGSEGFVDIEFDHMTNKRKGLTAYFGDLAFYDENTATEGIAKYV